MTTNILDIILRGISVMGLMAIVAFLCFGWLRGMSRELQTRKKHR